MWFIFVDECIYLLIEPVYLVCKRNYFTLYENKYKTRAVFTTRLFPLYLARNLTSDIKILVNYSKYTSKPFYIEKIRIKLSSQIVSRPL